MGILMSKVVPFFAAAGMEKGSKQYVRLATDPALGQVSGGYFVKGQEKKDGSSPLALDPTGQKRIEDVAERWAAPFVGGGRPRTPS